MNLGRPQAPLVVLNALAAGLVPNHAVPGAHVWVELALAAWLLATARPP